MVVLGTERVKQLKANGFPEAALYDPPGVGGTGVVTVLAHGDHLDWYGLPKDPRIPWSVFVAKRVFKSLGLVGIFSAIGLSVGHYMAVGPAQPIEGEDGPRPGQPPRVTSTAASSSAATALARGTEDVAVAGEIVRHRLSSRIIHGPWRSPSS